MFMTVVRYCREKQKKIYTKNWICSHVFSRTAFAVRLYKIQLKQQARHKKYFKCRTAFAIDAEHGWRAGHPLGNESNSR